MNNSQDGDHDEPSVLAVMGALLLCAVHFTSAYNSSVLGVDAIPVYSLLRSVVRVYIYISIFHDLRILDATSVQWF